MSKLESTNAKTIEVLERRALRERSARKEAEKLLVQKTREVYDAHESTKATRNLLEMAIWASGESIWDFHIAENASYFRYAKGSSREITESLVPLPDFIAVVHASDRKKIEQAIEDLKFSRTETIDCSLQISSKDGSYKWHRLRGKTIERNNEGTSTRVVGTLLDIDQMVQTEDSYKLMSYVFSSAREPMLILSESFDILEVNEAFLRRVQANKTNFTSWPLSSLIPLSKEQLNKLLKGEEDVLESVLNFDDISIPVELSLNKFSFTERGKLNIVCMLKDLTERKLSQKQLEKLAHFDALTDLLNRSSLQRALKQKIEDIESHDQGAPKQFAVLFIDLDGFKAVNDAMGHEAGDKLLRSISDVLNRSRLNKAIIARWGGDEFVAICELDDDNAWKSQADEMLEAFRHSDFDVKQQGFKVSASIGVALYPKHGRDVDTIIRNADLAMYEAKQRGKNQHLIYEPSLTENVVKRVTLINALSQALENEGLEFFLQGKYSPSGQVLSAEVLARWTSKEYGPVSPDVFVDLAEQHGMADRLGILALSAGVNFACLLRESGLSIPISVNISSKQITSTGFDEQAIAICQSANLAPEFIEMEITESVFLEDAVVAESCLKALQSKGFKVSLDDFGTGFSSLSYLKQIDFDTIKIDRSFLSDIHCDQRAKDLLSAISLMCKALNTEVVVEGVETKQDLDLLCEMGFDIFQGYYFSKAVSFKDFEGKHSR